MTIGKYKLGTASLTFIAMLIGAALGLVFGEQMAAFKFIGTVWLNCIKMFVCPLVLCIMITAIATQKSMSSLGRVAARILIYYMLTTVAASIIGLIVATVVQPGAGISLHGMDTGNLANMTKEVGGINLSVGTFVLGLFSENVFASLAKGDLMQTMVISIFLGISILMIKNEKKKETILNWFIAAKEMLYCFISIVIKMSPVGVLFLMADTFGTYGFAIFGSMASLIGTFWLGIAAQAIIVYMTCAVVMAHENPVSFFIKSLPVWTFTIATCSSVANIPNSIKIAKEKFGVPDRIASFSIPLGAQINYDGNAILCGVVMVYITQVYSLPPLDIATLVHFVIVASILSSVGGGIPSGGLIKLMMVVDIFGLPLEIIGIIAGFYRFFDMGVTAGNCVGDLVGTVCVSKMEERRAKRLGYKMDDDDIDMGGVDTSEM